jgi:hypothetical protein
MSEPRTGASPVVELLDERIEILVLPAIGAATSALAVRGWKRRFETV